MASSCPSPPFQPWPMNLIWIRKQIDRYLQVDLRRRGRAAALQHGHLQLQRPLPPQGLRLRENKRFSVCRVVMRWVRDGR